MPCGQSGISFVHYAGVNSVYLAESHIGRQTICTLIAVYVSCVMFCFFDKTIHASGWQPVSPICRKASLVTCACLGLSNHFGSGLRGSGLRDPGLQGAPTGLGSWICSKPLRLRRAYAESQQKYRQSLKRSRQIHAKPQKPCLCMLGTLAVVIGTLRAHYWQFGGKSKIHQLKC